MIKYFIYIVLLSLLALINANAGSPGGLRVVIIPLPSAMVYKTIVAQTFAEIVDGEQNAYCENPFMLRKSQFNIDLYYINKTLDAEVIYQALAMDTKMLALKKRLRDFRSKSNTIGLNALLTYEVKDDNFVIYGISSFEDVPVVIKAVPLKDISDAYILASAICSSLVGFPVEYDE